MSTAKRRSREPGAQAHLAHYPHLRSLGAVRVQHRAVVPMHEGHGSTAVGATILLQILWFAGIFLKIPVLVDLGYWPVAIAPAVAIFLSRSWSAALGSALTCGTLIPIAVLLIALTSLGFGAGIAWSRKDSLDWFGVHWQQILHGSLGSFFDLWIQMLKTAGPFAALGGMARLFVDLFRK